MNDEERQKELLRIQERLDARRRRQTAKEKAQKKKLNETERLKLECAKANEILSNPELAEQKRAEFSALCEKKKSESKVGDIFDGLANSVGVLVLLVLFVGLGLIFWINQPESESKSEVPWAGKDIVSIEEIKTDPSLNPVVGFRSDGKGGRKPVVGAMPKSGKTQWKVTWRDSNGVLRIQVTDQYPSR